MRRSSLPWTTLMRLERTSFSKRLGSYAEAIALPAQPIVEGRLLRRPDPRELKGPSCAVSFFACC